MESDFLRDYALAFLLTIALETAVAVLLGYRKQIELACVLLVNVFTHPLVNYLVWAASALWSVSFGPLELLPFELGVVIVEWLLLCYALPQHRRPCLFFLSLAMNSVSYLAGLLLFSYR